LPLLREGDERLAEKELAMLHVRKSGTVCLVFLISFAVFSAPPVAGAAAPFPAFWEWVLGWLPLGISAAAATDPPASREPEEGEQGDLGPEMDPNGNPPIRTTGDTGGLAVGYTPLQTGNFSSPEKTR
jgi:hypothetical protein